MKAHIGVDSKSGLVHSCEITTAKVADRQMLLDLLHEKQRAVFGNKGYVSKALQEMQIYFGQFQTEKASKKT